MSLQTRVGGENTRRASGKERTVPVSHVPPSPNNKTQTKGGKRNNASLTQQDFTGLRNGGVQEMKTRIDGLRAYLSDPTKKASARVMEFYNGAVREYDRAVRSSIGMPGYSSDVVTQKEAPSDIPTAPLSGYQLLQRTCYIVKLASSGTTAGGFYAELKASDLAPFVTNPYYRVKMVKSWTGTLYGNVGSSFAGVSVPASPDGSGTEVMPMWSENWQPVGQGFAGIITTYPLGDFPQINTTQGTVILSHFTALGGAGGVTGVPVIFHVVIECLV